MASGAAAASEWDVVDERPASDWDVISEEPVPSSATAPGRRGGLGLVPRGAEQIPGWDPQWLAGQSPAQQQAKRVREAPLREKVIGAVEAGIEALVQATGGYFDAIAAGGRADRMGTTGADAVRLGLQTNPITGPAMLALRNAGGGLGPQMSPTGQEYVEDIGDAMANLPPVVGVHGTLVGAAVSPATAPGRPVRRFVGEPMVRSLAGSVQAITDAVQRVIPDSPAHTPGTKGSAGAAATDVAAQRRTRARSLPVPFEGESALTEGQATRDYGQQRFEKETAKDPDLGKPLRERASNQNETTLRNLDALEEFTGSRQVERGPAGQAIVDTIAAKARRAKDEIASAYEKAREAGDMAEPVDAAPLARWLEENRSSAGNAGVISTAETELVRLGGAQRSAEGALVPREISINDLEELRKKVVAGGKKDATNAHFAGEINRVIDTATEGVGGELYKAARAKYRAYQAEFKERGAIRDLIGLKKGTTDRVTAMEKVLDRSMSSTDDLRNVRDTLISAGDDGVQAWRELQGLALRKLRDEVTRGALDERGNPIVSASKLKQMIGGWDSGGQLEVLFGKKGAETLRDLRDVAQDLFTAPPGAVNTSNTASVVRAEIARWAGELAGSTVLTGGLPLPLLNLARTLKRFSANRKLRKQVDQALGPKEPATAPADAGGPRNPLEGSDRLPDEPAPPAATSTGSGPARAQQTRRAPTDQRLAEIDRLRENASPETLKVLDQQRQRIERELRAEEVQRNRNAEATKLEATAQATDDPDIRQALQSRARELRGNDVPPVAEARELRSVPTAPVERPRGRLPIGEAKELPPASGRAPEIRALPVARTREASLEDFRDASRPEPIPTGLAREIPATPAAARAVEALKVDAQDQAAWNLLHRFGKLDAETVRLVTEATRYDPEAVDRAIVQHERSPRAFEREIRRIIDRGSAR